MGHTRKTFNIQNKKTSFQFLFSNDAPGIQSATSEWRLNWDSFMSSAKDFIVVTADVRGSGKHYFDKNIK